MAFSDYKNIGQILQKYPLKFRRERFLPDVQLELPSLVMDDLNFALERQGAQESELFFRESFIFPFLQQAWKRHKALKLWVNQALVYDNDLFGEPGYKK
jgi:hypothetical protein